ncbi:MAG TPA: PqqD family protein [Candidatus Baltobacteraceae bacterium]
MRPTLVATVVEDGAVLLDLDSKYFFAANKPAWAILQMVETGSASRAQIIRQCAAWGAPDDGAVDMFLDELCEQGILESGDDGGAPEAVAFEGAWCAPAVTRQAEPLQSVVTSAFDPSIPLAE